MFVFSKNVFNFVNEIYACETIHSETMHLFIANPYMRNYAYFIANPYIRN